MKKILMFGLFAISSIGYADNAYEELPVHEMNELEYLAVLAIPFAVCCPPVAFGVGLGSAAAVKFKAMYEHQENGYRKIERFKASSDSNRIEMEALEARQASFLEKLILISEKKMEAEIKEMKERQAKAWDELHQRQAQELRELIESFK